MYGRYYTLKRLIPYRKLTLVIIKVLEINAKSKEELLSNKGN